MTEPSAAHGAATSGAPLHVPMTARSPHEAHRVATPLELLFDLVFVVAISQAAAGLHHAVGDGHAGAGLLGYQLVFFAIWWAWMNFTWFASAYDVDDVPYRLAVFVQITGALSLAAGVPAMFDDRMPNTAVIGGFVVMRLAVVAQWLRASASDPERRDTARRYAVGIVLVQIAWVALFVEARGWLPGFLICAGCELLVPIWAERSGRTTWHPHHVTERYGLLTLIVLGESILAATVAIQAALASGELLSELLPQIVGGLLIVFSLWWVYFDRPVHDLLTSFRKAIVWGYGHYLVFASLAAVGAGLAVVVDQQTGHTRIGPVGAGAAVAIPVAVYLLCLWFLHDRPEYRRTRLLGVAAAILILLTPFTGYAVPLTGVILSSLVTIKLVLRRERPASHSRTAHRHTRDAETPRSLVES